MEQHNNGLEIEMRRKIRKRPTSSKTKKVEEIKREDRGMLQEKALIATQRFVTIQGKYAQVNNKGQQRPGSVAEHD